MTAHASDFHELLARISAYRFDQPSDVITFRDRLRRDYRWSAKTADRAILEYRRFVFLAVAAGHRVTPSPMVDKVWHLHLTDSRRYWDEFCPAILGRPLHHDPGRGGAAEAHEHQAQYAATLASYERFFGAPAPADLWPRRAPALAARLWRWLRRATGWAGFDRRLAAPALSPLALLLLAGCVELFDSAAPGGVPGPEFLMYYALLIVAAVALAAWLQARAVRPAQAPTTNPADLGPYEMAYLAQGAKRVLETGLLRLYRSGRVQLSPGGIVTLVEPLPPDAPPVEAAIGAAATGVKRFAGVSVIAQPVAAIKERLATLGLVPGPAERARAWRVMACVIVPVVLVGLIRLFFGVANQRPVTLLIIFIVAAVFGAFALSGWRMRSNSYGRALVQSAQEALPRRQNWTSDDPQLFYGMALYGTAILATAGLTDFSAFAQQLNAGSGDGSSGGDSGGGGCGGGGSCGG